jgi:hypothetical protein
MALRGTFKRVTITNCLFSAGADIAGVDIKAFAGVLARACKSSSTISATTRSAVETISFVETTNVARRYRNPCCEVEYRP